MPTSRPARVLALRRDPCLPKAPALRRDPRPARSRRPGRALLLALALASGCSREAPAAPGASGEAAGARGRLVVDEPLQDFGKVWEGSVLEHDFSLLVRGGPVAIHTVQADCGCTGSELFVEGDAGVAGAGGLEPYAEEAALPDGTRLVLRVRYHTRGRRGPAPREVHLYGDQEGGVTSVTVAANVRSWLTVDPERRSLGPMRADDVQQTTYVVQGSTEEPYRLRATGVGIPPAIHVSTRPADPDEDGRSRRWTVDVTAGPGLFEGVRGYSLFLETDVENPDAERAAPPGADEPDEAEPEEPSTHFGIAPVLTVEVVGDLSLRPQVLTFGGLADGELVSRTVRLSSYDAGFELPEPTARLLAIDGDEPSPLAATASFRARPVPGERAWDLELVLDGLAPDVPVRFLARLVVETGHPRLPQLEAKVSGYRRDLPAGGAPGRGAAPPGSSDPGLPGTALPDRAPRDQEGGRE